MAAKKHKKRPAPKKKKSRRRTTKCPPNAIPVTFTVDAQNQTVANPPTPVHVSKKNKEQVKWQSGKDFTVDFVGTNGSPFQWSHFSGGPGKPACSGPVVGTVGLDYKYVAQVAGALPLDPIIHTDP